jgi:hypothetical protein
MAKSPASAALTTNIAANHAAGQMPESNHAHDISPNIGLS